MSLSDFYSRKRGQLPPIAGHSKGYSIRKSARTHYNTSRGSAFDVRMARSVPVKKTPSRKRLDLVSSKFNLPFSLPDLELGKCIGRGKGGRVVIGTYACREYAIKVVSKDLLKYANIETGILERLDSHLVVKYYGKLEDEANVYIVLEYINGSDLFHVMRKQRLRQPLISNFARQVLDGLAVLHVAGIVYRDLKPENLMVDENKNVKFIDFGLSKVIDKDRTSTICGSPEYMAPEILRKNTYNYSVDVWAFGVLLFEMFCGHPPFQGDSYPEICKSILCGTYEFSRTVDSVARDLIRRLLHPEPNFRLGCDEGGINSVKSHVFFKDINWED